MAEKFRNKYRIPSARLQNWDYGTNGAYFITICTKDMNHFFGEVVDQKMNLNAVGVLAEEYWIEIVKHFPYIELGNFQIMPNHMHGILIIDKSREFLSTPKPVETRFIASKLENKDVTDPRFTMYDSEKNVEIVETRLIASLQQNPSEIGGFSGENNPMLLENISRIIRWYKGRCTFEMRKSNENFEWHSRFHDHIIRNSESFERIQNYIAENPLRWEEDKFYKE